MDANVPDVSEIQNLVDQCSPQQIETILATLETSDQSRTLSTAAPEKTGAEQLPEMVDNAEAASNPLAPMPPAAPPPAAGARRPFAKGPKNVMQATETESVDGGAITGDQLKSILDQHGESLLSEVKKLLPTQPPGVDIDMLTKVLKDRDREVLELEHRLADLQTELSKKDGRVLDLSGALDATVREVRHKQLDLEFQQLKLEERARNNGELEEVQRMLTARVEEASLNANHAALDAEICRVSPTNVQQETSVRVQGSLSWTLRKNRFGALGF